MAKVFYSPAYVRAGYEFDTTRKARWIADSLARSPIPGIELAEPRPLSRDEVAGTHDSAYVRAVQTGAPRALAQSQGFIWDAELWPAVLASNGGVVAAAHAALQHGVAGSLSSGLHHARHTSGAGFCTFNGLVIAARAAVAAGAKSVLILDLDAHCGGGTASLIAGAPGIRQVDVSVSEFDSYPPTEQARLTLVDEGPEYLPAIQRALGELDRTGLDFDICLYNAGMDPSEECAIGGRMGITRGTLAERERVVFAWCAERRLPIAFVLAGGYVGGHLDERGLVDLHRLTLTAAGSACRARR